MIIQTKDLQDISQKILSTVNTSDVVNNTDRLQLKLENNTLHVLVASDEFFVDITLPANSEEAFNAVVNANLFLKLVTQITSQTIFITADASTMTIKGNGTYTLPLLYDTDGEMVEVSPIIIKNAVKELQIPSEILLSLLKYNAKQLSTVKITSSPLQKVFYMDECGALTFTEGACINNFSLSEPIKVLLGAKVVKLFKLFEKDKSVDTVIGYDSVGGSEEIIQTKIKFSTPTVTVSAILTCDDTLLNSYPAGKIRQMASGAYPYSTTISKDRLLEAVNRLLLFHTASDPLAPVAKLNFKELDFTVEDARVKNVETVDYVDEIPALATTTYTAILNLNELKATLDTCAEDYITINFGNDAAIVVAKGNVLNAIPQRG